MSTPRRDRLFPRPHKTRHAWFLENDEPGTQPRQALIVSWRRRSYRWHARILYVVDVEGEPDPAVIERWVPREALRPVRADPNAAFGLR